MADAIERDALREREIKAARTRALALRQAAVVEPEKASTPYLVCACGEDRIGLPLSAVAQVLPGRPCTPVPGAGPALSGIVALSGRIVPVIGLARVLGRPETTDDADAHLVLLRGEPPVALGVARALAIVRSTFERSSASDAEGATLGNRSAADYVPAADGAPDFTIIDPAQVLRRVMP